MGEPLGPPRSRMLRERPLALALLVLPFPIAALTARACLPGLGDRIARGLAVAALKAAPLVERPSPHEMGGAPDSLAGPGDARAGNRPLAGGGIGAGAAPLPRASANGSSPRRTAAPKSLHIPATQVARALSGGLDGVRGRTARDADGRAFGVRLTGVSRLAVGLADGDIVTSIDGTKTPDDDTATAIALGAVGRGARTVRATVLRGADPIDVVVDLPTDDAPPR